MPVRTIRVFATKPLQNDMFPLSLHVFVFYDHSLICAYNMRGGYIGEGKPDEISCFKKFGGAVLGTNHVGASGDRNKSVGDWNDITMASRISAILWADDLCFCWTSRPCRLIFFYLPCLSYIT